MQANNHHFTAAWRVFFALASLQAALALVWLLQGASEAGSSLILGFSPARLVLIGVICGLLVCFAWLLVRSWINPGWSQRQIDKLLGLPRHPRTFGGLFAICSLVLLGGLYSITLTPELQEPFTAAVFNRFLPILTLVTGLSAQALLVLILVRFGLDARGLWQGRAVFWLALAVFCLFFIGWGWVIRTTLPDESAITGWNDLGVPILETQVFLAWLAGMATWALTLLIYNNTRSGKHNPWLPKFWPVLLDLLIFLILWGGTVLLWNNTPAVPSWFLSIPRPPNYELYPNSDALAYDLSAQSLLNGEGILFANEIYVRRPALALFFAILHLLGGQNISMVIVWQIVFLALIPAFIFLLGKALHSRPAGVIAGVLVALRGANAIALAGSITTSHVKILMADLPAALAMVIFLLLATRWLQTRSKNLGLLSGGFLGIAILIRPELASAILAVSLISILVYRRQLRQWLVNFLLFAFGIGLVLAPWIYRNWSLTGLIFLDTPSFRSDWLQERYNAAPPTPTPTLTPDIIGPSQDSTFSISNPQFASFTDRSPQGALLEPIVQVDSPARSIARFVTSHYLNSQVQLFLTLPTTFRPLDSLVAFGAHRSSEQFLEECCSVLNYIRRLPYWHKWYGEIPLQATMLLALNLVLVALGIQQSWKRNRWVGFLPLTITFIHLLTNALARNSGGRYIMTVDWVWILYFGSGLLTASVWVVNLFTRKKLLIEVEIGSESAFGSIQTPDSQGSVDKKLQSRSSSNIFRTPQFYLLAALLFAIGWTAPVLEKAIPPRYTEQKQAQMLSTLLVAPELTIDQKEHLASLLEGKAVVTAGKALYPRYYQAGQGEPDSSDPLGPQDYPRLGFYLTGEISQPIVLPLADKPEFFPNGADTLVIRCPDGQTAVVALFESANGALQSTFFRSGELLPSSCINPFLDE